MQRELIDTSFEEISYHILFLFYFRPLTIQGVSYKLWQKTTTAILHEIFNKKFHVKTWSISLPLWLTEVYVIFRIVDIFYYKITNRAWKTKYRRFGFHYSKNHTIFIENDHQLWQRMKSNNILRKTNFYSYQKNLRNISWEFLIWCIIMIILVDKK